MNVKVQLLTKTAKMPTKAHNTDACFDLYADEKRDRTEPVYIIEPGKSVVIPTGIATEIPVGYFAPVYVRSGLGIKKHLRLSNSVGVIDSDYRGEWMVSLHNDGTESQTIHPGDRIAQFTLQEVFPVELTHVKELNDSERGTGGFGSSGK